MTRLNSLITRSVAALLIAGGALTSNALAQSDETITARIPFPFTVGTQTMAAGTYEFSLPTTHFTLAVLNVKTRETEMFNVHPEEQRAIEQEGRLVFRNYEDGSVLNEIHFRGTGVFSEVVERRGSGRMEAKSSSPDGSISIAAR